MPVSEYGEIGVLVKPDEVNKMVIHWRVRRKVVVDKDNYLWKWEKGDLLYYTSMGWIVGAKDGSDYFEPTQRERSLRPCILRAEGYAEKMWPGWRGETH